MNPNNGESADMSETTTSNKNPKSNGHNPKPSDNNRKNAETTVEAEPEGVIPFILKHKEKALVGTAVVTGLGLFLSMLKSISDMGVNRRRMDEIDQRMYYVDEKHRKDGR
jgi:hypothetical protein